MAAKPKVKFMVKGRGVVHVVTTKRWDQKNSKCSTVRKGHDDGVWRGKGLSPEAALALGGCGKCVTHEVAEAERKARMTPAQKRAETIRVRNETRQKMAPAKPSKKPKAKAEQKRRGPKRVDAAERMKEKCEDHAAFARQHGWDAKVIETGPMEWMCEATRSGETLKVIYRDGRMVWSRVVLASGVEVRLRNSTNWKKHAEGKGKVKPDYVPRKLAGGKKAAKSQAITDDAAAKSKLPFTLDDDTDTIIESLVSRRITWRNGTTKTLDSAVLPQRSRNCRVTVHPKSGRRIISFYESQGVKKDRNGEVSELLGGERSVYLDKILRVK